MINQIIELIVKLKGNDINLVDSGLRVVFFKIKSSRI